MKNETLQWILEVRNAVKEVLKKEGFEESRNYEIRTYTNSESDKILAMDLDFNPDLKTEDKFKLQEILGEFQNNNCGQFDPKAGTNIFGLGYSIDDEQHRTLSEISDIDAELENYSKGNAAKNNHDYNSEDSSWKSGKTAAEPENIDTESTSDTDSQVNGDYGTPGLKTEQSKPERIKKSFSANVMETFNDRGARKNAIGCAVISGVASLGVQAVKAYCETSSLEGESRLHKTKRVVRTIVKQPRTWMITLGTSALAYGISIVCQAGTRMR